MKEIRTEQEYQEVKNRPGKQVVLWSAAWCPDCVYIRPFLPDLEEEFADFTFYTADRDALLDLGIEEKIMGIPSFLVYENGRETARFVSKLRKTREEIEAFLNDARKKGEPSC